MSRCVLSKCHELKRYVLSEYHELNILLCSRTVLCYALSQYCSGVASVSRLLKMISLFCRI